MVVFLQMVLPEQGDIQKGREYWRVGNRDKGRKRENAEANSFILIL